MRDVKRMKPVLDVFAEIQEVRGLTVMQIFTALQENAGWDLFYMEDEELYDYARRFFCVSGEKECERLPVIDTLDEAWHLVPDWRLAQLLGNMWTGGIHKFGDDELTGYLKRYFKL